MFVAKAIKKMAESKLNIVLGGYFRGADTAF
jgi:hypothetical protein